MVTAGEVLTGDMVAIMAVVTTAEVIMEADITRPVHPVPIADRVFHLAAVAQVQATAGLAMVRAYRPAAVLVIYPAAGVPTTAIRDRHVLMHGRHVQIQIIRPVPKMPGLLCSNLQLTVHLQRLPTIQEVAPEVPAAVVAVAAADLADHNFIC